MKKAKDYKKIIADKKLEAGSLMTSEQVKKCNIAIHSASVAAGAEGAIPLPGVDAIPISATQIAMVIGLGKIFDQNLSESTAKSIIGAAAATFVGRNLVKFIPIIGWGISAAVAAGITEAIGWMSAVDFAKNYRKEWERKKSAEQAAHSKIESEYYKKSAQTTAEAEDFSE